MMQARTRNSIEGISNSALVWRTMVQAAPGLLLIYVPMLALDGRYYARANREYTPPYVSPYTVSQKEALSINSLGLTLLTDVGTGGLLLFLLLGFDRLPDALCHAASAVNGYGMQRFIIYCVKSGVGALRPNGEYGSFPSGHAGNAAGWCYYGLWWVLSHNTRSIWGYFLQVFASLCLMSYPWFVACMRMLGSKHYAVDVTAGILIGAVASAAAFACQRNNKLHRSVRYVSGFH